MLTLYKHNQQAYKAAANMLAETGKAAVIHPTGTGKSYIAFKLCEDHPESRVLWLSPSRYIFDVQIENLKRTGESVPENIQFYTYAKLALMAEKEMAEFKPDYLVLDEFHRCGAEVWGKNVNTLLKMYNTVPVLGLSATNIRYLDNQRDMADELFDGNIASEMTLGEAIVQGILKPPTYVTALYGYQREFKRLESRVRHTQDKVVRDKGEQDLECLRRALEKAEGLDIIFEKYMTKRDGKYIVFCANKEHMDEMVRHIPEWFGGVDAFPHVYRAYSNDPETSTAFAGFVADQSSHLKLLFCIDMLNEGIHVEDVAGVILFRPTVSPIVYKQQIGRAMSAGSKDGSLILDIVDNISGLSSIGAIQQEMQQAINVYRFYGEDEKVIAENFQIIDEAQDCRRLFEELENTFSASWELMYEQAKKYYKKYGNLELPRSYQTEEGYPLGKWLFVQRDIYRGMRAGKLNSQQIKQLNAIGMDWRTTYEKQWDENFETARKFAEKMGSLVISKQEKKDPVLRRLAYWLQHQRDSYNAQQLSQNQIQRLDSIGMPWGIGNNWQIGFDHAKRYFEEKGNLDIPAQYVSKDGYGLGNWYRMVRGQKRRGELSEDRQKQLEVIGIQWESVLSRNWMQYYEAAKQYYQEYGDLAVNVQYKTQTGLNLGVWISSQRYAYQKGKLSADQIRLLDDIEMLWQQFHNKWNYGYSRAEEYFDRFQNLEVPADYRCEDGFKLGVWIGAQRTKQKNGKLSPVQIERLNKIGMVWDASDAFWCACYEKAKQYYRKSGDLLVPLQYKTADGIRLGSWIGNQRSRYRSRELSKEQIRKLEAIGMVWNVESYQWKIGYSHLVEYKDSHASVKVPQRYVSGDGYKLGGWVSQQHRAYKQGKLLPDRAEKLQSVGIIFPKESSPKLEA